MLEGRAARRGALPLRRLARVARPGSAACAPRGLITNLTTKQRRLIIMCADHGDAFGRRRFPRPRYRSPRGHERAVRGDDALVTATLARHERRHPRPGPVRDASVDLKAPVSREIPNCGEAGAGRPAWPRVASWLPGSVEAPASRVATMPMSAGKACDPCTRSLLTAR